MVRGSWMALVAMAVAMVLGCSGDTEEPAGPEDEDCYFDASTEGHELGEWTVWISEEEGHWWVRDEDGERVVESPGSCADLSEESGPAVSWGEGEPWINNRFGAFDVDFDRQMEWREAGGAVADIVGDDEAVEIWWEVEEQGALGLVFSLVEGRDLSLEVVAQDVDEELNGAGLAMGCRPEEAFFGLGSQAVGMELRGRTYPLWTQEQGNGKNDDPFWPLQNYEEAAYAPMGIWHSSEDYTALLGHDGFHELDLCDDEEGRMELRAYPDAPELVLVAGEDVRQRIEHLGDYIGRLEVAPDWVFGPWNDAVSGPFRLWQVADHLRDNDVPSSAIWAEDWIGGELTATGFRLSYRWSWDPETYPDLPDDIEALQSKGFAFLAYFNPFVPDSVPRFEEAVEEGYLIEDEEGEPYMMRDPAFRDTSLVDLTSSQALEWTRGYMETAVEELNIDGWMVDFAEWLPTDAVLASGESGWREHNRYPLRWQAVNRESLEASAGEEWTFFARSGWASAEGGAAGHTPTMWGGDQDTTFSRVEGMPSIVPIGAHLGLSGVAIFGSDIAGYSSLSGSNTNKELFLRWAAIGAFHPLMRTHHGSEKCDNWMYDSDEETLAAYRRYAQIHTVLLPYFQGLREEAKAYGWPMIRHPYLVAPEDRRLWEAQDYQFFLGDDLLVAPILEEGETRREVVLPKGDWWPLFGEAVLDVEGEKRRVEREADYADIPVFFRGGRGLTLLAEPVDSLYGSSDPEISDLGDVEGRYRVALYPDGEGRVEATAVGDGELEGQGLMGEVDWREASVDGQGVAGCEEPRELPCATEEGLWIGGDVDAVEVGGAELGLNETGAEEIRLGLGREAWGEMAKAPAITELDPPLTSYCEDLPEDQQID